MKHHLLAALATLAWLAASSWAGEPAAPEQEARHRKLDRLQALGVGMLRQQAPKPPEPHQAPIDRPRMSDAELRQRTIAQNAESAAALTKDLEKIKADCNGQVLELPEVGMSDDLFRRCTLHAHFGGVSQIVVIDDGSVPLRLYVFPSERAHKVYAIGGVITAIRP